MNIKIICPVCELESHTDPVGLVGCNEVTVPANDSSIYDIECSEGHRSRVGYCEQAHEKLARNSIYALIDGYHQEAVANMAAAVERFHEYIVTVFLNSYDGASNKKFAALWKHVENQSERQLGAFLFLYFRAIGSEPPKFILDNDRAKFRNRNP